MRRRETEWWDMWFLGLAKYVATASKDPSTKVGAVIVDSDNRVVSIGYNGFPKGIKDDSRLECRDQKYKIVTHAEIKSLLFAKTSVTGCSVYTYPFMPCPSCAGAIIQSGIKRVVSFSSDNPRWAEDFEVSNSMFNEAGVEFYEYQT